MTSAKPTVYLFDIDGTILLTGGAGRRSFEHAFRTITGSSEAVSGFTFEGMTDLAIARRGLLAIGREPDAKTMTELVECYLETLNTELLRTSRYVVMPNVREVVAELSAITHAAVGLGTGNVKRGAMAKLAHGQLWHLFDFGGFGCDHEERHELLRKGAERGAQKLNAQLSDCRIVVIGDTVRDIAAAHAIGAECLAVCTGGGTEDALRAAGADAVFADLSARGAATWLLG